LAASNKNKALTLDERRVIETGIRNGSTKTAIADTIGKDKSTVGKEIRRHRILKHKCTMPLECSNYAKCKFHRHCLVSCPSYLKFSCTRRDRSPGACNGCGCYTQCRFNKYYYDAHTAHEEYRKELVDSREGVNLTVSQAKEMAAVIGPLLKKGHSPYQIIHDNPGLGISEKTLYNYISQQVFSVAGIYDIDLRRKVSRRPSKKLAKTYKKRENRAFLKGREYKDFLAYRDEHPHAHILQMDTVYNDVSNGPFIQTFKFIGLGLMAAVFHNSKTATDMVHGLDLLDEALGSTLFNEHAHILLTDRGTEFSDADGLEIRGDSTRRCRVFYCDPMQSGQKGYDKKSVM
jgi:IS30 family transposase